MRWSISSGWADIWTLRRWTMQLRMVWLALGLIGAAATFAWGFGGSGSSAPVVVPDAQLEALCQQAARDTERVARDFEEQTGQRARAVSKEDCVPAGRPASPPPREERAVVP